ncbi:MAG: polymerase, sigma subunit, family [Ilumatobacteraceae bacterium]|nr:polymerase, sigma subunit, family [Ilumatobacteraceae bacterium]
MTAADPTAAIEAVFRIEFPRLVAGLTRRVGDIGLAEELAQDALVDALAQWPGEGTPRNPGAWLMAVAKRKAVDRFRRDRTLASKVELLGRDPEHGGRASSDPVDELADDDHIADDRLRLMFVACHPVLPVPARVALTLRLLGGLTTAEIARAHLVPESTIAQRIVRAKKTIAAAGIPFEVPAGDDRAERLGSVLDVVYLIFNEGYSATAGDEWFRHDLCREALRLGRLLAALAPTEPEVQGLVALIEIQSSRLTARVGPGGEPVLLLDQDRRRWDRLLINRGLASLDRAMALSTPPMPGPFTLQAAIAACHARAARAEDTDWQHLLDLYDALASVMPSPIVELNRAVALSMAAGPAAGLDLVDQLIETHTLDGYHLLHSVRADLLTRLDRHREAHAELELAASLAANAQERQLSEQRARDALERAESD